jgi:Ca2+-transporting ATPase
VHEALFTGEEEAITKTTKQDSNLLFMGTTVLSGTGIMKVTRTGQNTQMGCIGQSIAEVPDEKTPVQIKLDVFARHLAIIVLCICSCVFIFGVLNGETPLGMLKMAIILSMAAIPQGISIAITMILSLSMRRILKKHGLVKKLVSIETLGVTSVICIDKTGTLTEGNMRVVKTDFIDNQMALCGLIFNNNRKNNLEVAIWNHIAHYEKFNVDITLEQANIIYREPFDGEKKYALVINQQDSHQTCFIVGAPEILLSFCQLNKQEKDIILTKIDVWADEGLRILGVIYKDHGDLNIKKDFKWLGLVGIADPVRKEAKETLHIAQQMGISVKIVTGDYRKTAERIAKNLGLPVGPDHILEGQQLEVISDDALKQQIDNIVLFVRVTPHQKQKIIRVLQEKGEIVAMTGDGVNDAPALKKADIGVTVATACDVAKEAADLILLDNNFKTIVDACQEGRLIFYNIKKTIGYVLSNSFAEITLIFSAVLLKFPAPLTVVQILWIKLICDGPPDLMLAFEPAEQALMKQKPQDIKKEEILSNLTKTLIVVISLTAGILTLGLFWFFGIKQNNLALGQTIAFASLASVSLVYIFTYKNLRNSLFRMKNFFQNKFMLLGVAYGFVLLILAIYVHFFNRVLETVPLAPLHWILIFGVGFVVTITIELIKKLFRIFFE